MTDQDSIPEEASNAGSVESQLRGAARDLWSMVEASGEDFVVFMDRRRLSTRVQRTPQGTYRLSWQQEDGTWLDGDRQFENPREAAFHAYQGPH
jgi:hypothetical protein